MFVNEPLASPWRILVDKDLLSAMTCPGQFLYDVISFYSSLCFIIPDTGTSSELPYPLAVQCVRIESLDEDPIIKGCWKNTIGRGAFGFRRQVMSGPKVSERMCSGGGNLVRVSTQR
jgi:hypothetical protein